MRPGDVLMSQNAVRSVSASFLMTLLLAGCDQAYVSQPPKARQGDAQMTVVFATEVDAACRRIGAQIDLEKMAVGCHNGHTAVVPNPCSWPNRSDYADTLCHELGHENGGHHDAMGQWGS